MKNKITVNDERIVLRVKSTKKHRTNCASNIDEDINIWVMISTYTQWVTKTVFYTDYIKHKLKQAIEYNPFRDVKHERNICSN